MSWLDKAVVHTLPLVPKPVVRRVSSRYIAGERLEDAVACVRDLNAQGFMATLDVLGEFVHVEEEARNAAREYVAALDRIAREKLGSNVSLKLTQMGLKIDRDLCTEITAGVVERARELGSFVRLDMEDSSCTTDTLEVYRRLQARYPDHVGCVIQAYLKRSAADVKDLVRLGANVRLCKGIYVEPETIAYTEPGAINGSFERLLGDLLRGGCYTGIATHDAALVDPAVKLLDELRLDRGRYEFQMLLGVTEGLRARLQEGGHRLRVYVPFGSHWHAYSLRRLKENPKIAGQILRNIFNGNS